MHQKNQIISKKELDDRLKQFRILMNGMNPDWDTAFILSKVNQYYFTGTMQDGLLAIRNNGEKAYFVHRSIERANDESNFSPICAMEGYRDAALVFGKDCGNAYFETEIVTIAILDRLKKHFSFTRIGSLDKVILVARAVKTSYELEWMEIAGKIHDELMISTVPQLLQEGISEAEFTAELYEKMVKKGHQGITRFSMFQTEMIVGQIGFGESSLYPTYFDGPGGAYGMYPAVPSIGSRERLLKKGDLVFVDIGFGMNGYHTDKTQVYLFGGRPSDETLKAHRDCMEIQKRLAESLIPGHIPSVLYNTVMEGLAEDFKINFMGIGNRSVKFLGHGIGLHINEPPVIAKGFDQPFAAGMVMALEPKKGIPAIGMVGVEDTYIVEPGGGRCITGGGRDIIRL